jgi:membrane protease YdiL (CAAX protease family)
LHTTIVPLILVMACQMAFLVAGIMLRREKPRPAPAPNAAFSLAVGLLTGLTAAFLLIVLGLLYDGALRIVFGAGTPTLGPWAAVRELGAGPAVAVGLWGVVLGPAGDELFCRGVLFRRFERAGRSRLGAAVSALLFAASRLDPSNFIAYTAMGLLLAWLYQRTGTVVTSWTAHAATNGVMFALLLSGYE